MTETAEHFRATYAGDTRTTAGRTLTTADILNFAGVSGDFAPLHVDEEFARTTPYGGTIAHGLLTLVVTTTLASAVRPFPAIASYGYERLRFVAPVRPGDTVRVRVTTGELTPRAGSTATVGLGYETVNQRGETVLACTHLVLVDLEDERWTSS
jgi:acyl dehydratase